MSTYPPQPWSLEEQPIGTAIKSADGQTIARVSKRSDALLEERVALLFRASPGLLEAAKELEQVLRLGIPREAVPLIHHFGLWDELVAARIHIEKAIAEAEGGAPR